ncbi:outer membrane protein [Aequorivita sublithincola DSM 14238]|uniref:Outer membrane protein n=1 Tax=Aequorivita sublithincola (strain DSM 14238 / LMG 21431 / ACAM 643 / 9-3) TaxID=746697 RepID=I3YTG9_AEQSU|nr:TolC family protein [Aequorivita sublithincola]AFL80287.1 outer membrane protein [Aequorivita sublithincola DSM 14238]
MKNIKYLTLLGFMLLGLNTQTIVAQQMQERIMTVQELAESVQANNIQLKLAKSSVDVSDATIGEVKVNRLPDIGTDVSAFYLSDVSIYDTGFNKLQKVDIPNFGNQFNVNVSQLIFAGGKINKSIELAEMSKTLSENQLGDTEQGIKLSATELYLNLYNLQNQKTILKNNRDLATERTKNTEYFYEQDMITKNEMLRAQVLERQLEQSILQVENAILITNKNLTLLAGLDENILIIPTIDNINHQIRKQDETFYREIAFQKNPQLTASDTQIAIAEKNLELTRTDRSPILAGFAGYNASRPQTSGTPADLYSNTYQVGLSLSYNIETLFKNPKKEAVDKVLIDQATLAKEAVRQRIEGDVNAAFKNYNLAIAQLEVSSVNQSAADENYRITELKYKNQLVTYIEIIDAANTKLQAELQMLDDQTDIILNYVRLLRVTGQL